MSDSKESRFFGMPDSLRDCTGVGQTERGVPVSSSRASGIARPQMTTFMRTSIQKWSSGGIPSAKN